MKTFSILLLTAMIAIFAEKYMARYLLVEMDRPEGEVNPSEGNVSSKMQTELGSTIFNLLNFILNLKKLLWSR